MANATWRLVARLAASPRFEAPAGGRSMQGEMAPYRDLDDPARFNPYHFEAIENDFDLTAVLRFGELPKDYWRYSSPYARGLRPRTSVQCQ